MFDATTNDPEIMIPFAYVLLMAFKIFLLSLFWRIFASLMVTAVGEPRPREVADDE